MDVIPESSSELVLDLAPLGPGSLRCSGRDDKERFAFLHALPTACLWGPARELAVETGKNVFALGP